jgi:hypothetical protein
MLLLVGFALPPVLQLRNVPHNRVIRREQAAPQPMALATYGLGTGVFVALLLWQAGDPKLALLTAGGFLAGLLDVAPGQSVMNAVSGGYELVTTPWLEATALTGYSSTTYYGIADPNLATGLILSKITGYENIQVQEYDAGAVGARKFKLWVFHIVETGKSPRAKMHRFTWTTSWLSISRLRWIPWRMPTLFREILTITC